MTHINKFSEITESLFFYSKTQKIEFKVIFQKKDKPSKYEPYLPVNDKSYRDYREIGGKKYFSPPGRKWGIKQEDIESYLNEGRLVFENNKWWLITYDEPLKDVWIDYQGYSRNWGFPTENSEIYIKRAIQSTSKEGDLVMDFFLGSGTTCAVAHKLRRKWIGIEMGEHFYTIVLPRMKKVLAYDKSGISKDEDVKQNYNKDRAGGFFKYYELEQYEET
ncbi:MAG: site-specific DNA-methyltransferase, partial [Thermodesulfovibrio sp.]|nr:site-specific DNA-methyltransferase [Thermodesulfovibrio sp.]